ncbi:DUF5060 domain-containing protein [Novipirellula herctigrandis]
MIRIVGLGACLLGTILLVARPAEADNSPPEQQAKATISGELQQWHKVTLTLDGPQASEDGTPNPFLDYRMQVTFRHPATGLTYVVPGYFAADGDAANTSATSGDKWRAHLSPDHSGQWTYAVSFRKGTGVAISDAPEAGTSVSGIDNLKGTFRISKTDKSGRDFRSKGRLNYVGKHHLQFAGTNEFFLKAGADAPENFLAYKDFDGDFKTDGKKDNLVKDWAPHVQDWHPGDPTWQSGKGKGIIGAVNYLASQGLNSFSFLTLNIEGDDRNVFPYTTYDERGRIDCSRMDQWETVFAHGTNLGMYLHFKTLEAENVNLLDDGHMGPQRKLYYRELIARFAHHLALNWNLGEEVGLGHDVSTQKKKDWAEYFWTHDPYQHHIVIHNGNNHFDLLGPGSTLTGFSLQTNQADFRNVHNATRNYIRRSVEAGKPWVVACDEPGDAQHSLIPDDEDPTRDNARKNALWGNIMAGGAGVEWYFGYKHAHSDLTCQDYRVRQTMWKQCRTALSFFADHQIPFWNMTGADEKLDSKDAYCLCESGKLYLVYLKHAEPITLDLSDAKGVFEVLWFNPRTGGALQGGSTAAVNAGGKVVLGIPPSEPGQDWLAVVRPGDPKKDYPPGVSAGADITVMLPRSSDTVTVDLKGDVSDDGKPGAMLTTEWTKISGPGKATFADATIQDTKVTLKGAGMYVLNLAASDGKHSAKATVNINVEPFQSKVTRSLNAIDDAYIEGANVLSDTYLKVEGKRRIALIKFDLQGLPPNILDAQLRLTGSGDAGGGTLRVSRGSHSDWTGVTMKKESAPKQAELLGKQSVSVGSGDSVKISVLPMIKGDGIYTVIVTLDEGGDDIWFGATGTGAGPELLITYEDPDGLYAKFGQVEEGDESPVLTAMTDFKFVVSGDFVPGYKDENQRAMAINAAKYQAKFAAAESKFQDAAGTYDLVLTTLTETDGESSYRLLVAGKKLGEVQNPATGHDYEAVTHRFNGVELKPGDTIRVEFNSASNGKIPEGDGFAFSRGRWRSVAILKPGASIKQKKKAAKKPALAEVVVTPFVYSYDPAKAKKVHMQSDDIVVIEAEDFDAVDRQDHRKWYLTTADINPNVKPDPDPNHAEGSSGGAYLEILPDTRVTHADPLVNGVSFSNVPGQCSVLYYPVIIKKPGRYYVWARICCTGSEDNGLHVGIDGTWPQSGARLQFTGKSGQWQWDSRQRTERVHTGVLGQIWLDIDKPGLHTIMFSMREDGFEFDKFMLTPNPKPMESKTSEMGPPASPSK